MPAIRETLLAARHPLAITAVLIASVILFLSTSLTTRPASGKTIVRYCQWSGIRHQPVVWAIKEAFERQHPDIEIKLEFYTREYRQKLLTMVAAGVAPDVWYISAHDVPDLARFGLIEALDPYMERDGFDVDEYFQVIVDSFRYRGGLYGLSMQFGAIALFYNQDLFRQHGVAPPDSTWSWQHLLEAARALTLDLDGDGVIDQYGVSINSSMESVVANFIFQNGGRIMDETRTRILIDSPEARQAVQFLVDLREKHKVAPGVGRPGLSGMGALELFETGRIAMAFEGSWRMDFYNRSGQLNYDVAPLPMGPDGGRGMCANGLANALNANSDVKEAAWKWMHFYASEEAQRLLGEWKRGIPSMRRIAEEPGGVFLSPDLPPQSEAVFLQQMDEAHDLWPSVAYAEWMDRLGQELDAVFQGSKTTAQALKDATDFGNGLIRTALAKEGQ
jgi:multiple sugar transport system substrate-binding protein